MDYKKIALFSDLDGTLFNSRTAVPEKNREAITRFVNGGGLFGISTGRGHKNAAPYLTEVKINGPSIVYNGSAIYSYDQKKILKKHALPTNQVREFLRMIMDCFPQLNVQVYPPEGDIWFVSPSLVAVPDFLESHRPYQFTSLDKAKGPWLKSLIMGNKKDLNQVYALGKSYMEEYIDFVFSSNNYLELLPRGINKGSALREAAHFPEVKDRIIVTIGDFYNDLELLKEADISVAPNNAVKEVKDLAKYLVCSNNKGAVAELIDYILPQIK
ncbi:HAD family hydrolase [Clostridium sp. HBUAS56010]|uniref:HAD family hydrolase n=1 Tax=Clostridium sp. HBUAS56010 TaxID=2571127 RepID=UPI0011783929|nr:HAD family hydrolase [Clostridium sp. HBUAS56010]